MCFVINITQLCWNLKPVMKYVLISVDLISVGITFIIIYHIVIVKCIVFIIAIHCYDVHWWNTVYINI